MIFSDMPRRQKESLKADEQIYVTSVVVTETERDN